MCNSVIFSYRFPILELDYFTSLLYLWLKSFFFMIFQKGRKKDSTMKEFSHGLVRKKFFVYYDFYSQVYTLRFFFLLFV